MIAQLILEESSKITPEFGIELIDVQIKRVNYVDEVQERVFERMIAERQRIAAKYRSEGDGSSAEIRGQKERELIAEIMPSGTHTVGWDGRDDNGAAVSSGIYISRLKMGEHVATQTMIHIK